MKRPRYWKERDPTDILLILTTCAAFDDEILSQIEVGEIETDIVDSEMIAYKIAQM